MARTPLPRGYTHVFPGEGGGGPGVSPGRRRQKGKFWGLRAEGTHTRPQEGDFWWGRGKIPFELAIFRGKALKTSPKSSFCSLRYQKSCHILAKLEPEFAPKMSLFEARIRGALALGVLSDGLPL